MTVRIWGNPRTISNLNCLFSMHNWKWVNLSKMAGFNISLSLNEGKVAPTKSTTKAYVSFCFSLSAVVSPALYRFFIDCETNETIFHSISEMFFTFLAKKTLWVKLFSLNLCEAALQAAIKGGNFGAKLTHLSGFWLDVSLFSHVKKHRSRFSLEVSFFLHVKTIVRSSYWLELICVRKFTT